MIWNNKATKEQRNTEKARVTKQALAEHFPANVEIWESGGGLYFWARLPQGISAAVKSKMFQSALKNDVLYVPGELCSADDPSRAKPDNEMRISFGSANAENIPQRNRAAGQGVKEIFVTRLIYISLRFIFFKSSSIILRGIFLLKEISTSVGNHIS